MNGDFSRDTFRRAHRFSRVLMQQGRVSVDADENERTSIFLHCIRTLARDLIGPHGGPGDGFRIRCPGPREAAEEEREREREEELAELEEAGRTVGDVVRMRDVEEERERRCDFSIGYGHYYVDGILVENLAETHCPPTGTPARITYKTQPDYPLTEPDRLQPGTEYLVYLDVWERHMTHLEVDHIREVALGGPDTATRTKVVWQVKIVDRSHCAPMNQESTCEELVDRVRRKRWPCLSARARIPQPSDDPCLIPPEARYRGAENQLYRVEVHRSGKAEGSGKGATIKWSRDNASVLFGVRDVKGNVVSLDSLGPDRVRSLEEGDWVEYLDDWYSLRGEPGVLARVAAVDRVKFEVTLDLPEDEAPRPFNPARHPLLKRWDNASDAIPVREGKWMDLEDGVQIRLEPGGRYRTGDYWRIPARTETGDVLWPLRTDEDGAPSPKPLRPEGIRHHLAPLARIRVDEDRTVHCLHDCRCVLEPPCPHEEERGEAELEEGFEDVRPVPTNPDEAVRPVFDGPAGVLTAAKREEVVAELRTINQVGRSRANALVDAGLREVDEVARLSVADLRSTLDVGERIAELILENAERVVRVRTERAGD